ncbi:hydrolase alpha/beta [Acidisphaera rubrifaciens HS-AP3]|uniref:Hydrolase alpha/beta n=1 Tax=Acidisphaera rubrifaciens HS-AP3 TaxID=1231350 RepID=A0A0D6P284_9PROT|nr:hydrolase alpha/beta [Acidisphaera rubrifaciens HS-AP3]
MRPDDAPAAQPPTARRLDLSIDGRSVEACVWEPAGAPSGPTIVLLHEGLGSVAMWRDFPARLAARTGKRVFAYSRFGYGLSDPEPLPWPPSYLHDHARRMLGRVLDAAGIGQRVLVGHSDGGSIAAIYGGEAGDRLLAGLVLIAAHFIVEDVTIAGIRAAGIAYRSGLRARLSRFHRDVDNAFHGWNDTWLRPGFATMDLAEQIAGISVPVLAIQGEADEYGTAAQLDHLRRHLKTSPRIVLVPDVGHTPQAQAADRVLDEIDQFMHYISATRR